MRLLLILAVVAVVVIWRYLRSRRGRAPAVAAQTSVDATPDLPVDFGYKMLWLAVRSEEPEGVVGALGGSGWQRANWRSGVAAAYGDAVFVSPSVDGWVLVLDPGLPNLGDPREPERWGAFMKPLAERFPEVHYFATHRVVEYHAWARFEGGELLRAFAYVGESGETPVDFGEPTGVEIELGHDFGEVAADGGGELEDESPDLPSEEDVVRVAGGWSLDPTRLSERGSESGLGWLRPPPPAAEAPAVRLPLRHRLWVWTTFRRPSLKSLARRARQRLGLPPKTRRARILWHAGGGGWRICPSGLSPEGVGVDQVEDETTVPADAAAGEVVAALRVALVGCRFLDAAAHSMPDAEWRKLFQSHLMVSAFVQAGTLRLQGWERVRRRGGSYYRPIDELDASVAADAPPEEVFDLLRDLVERIEQREAP